MKSLPISNCCECTNRRQKTVMIPLTEEYFARIYTREVQALSFTFTQDGPVKEEEVYVCSITKRRTPYTLIPDWCPLEDVKG